MAAHARYDDVVSEVVELLVHRAEQARAAGVSQVWIDPGIGFGKTPAHNLSLLRHLDRFVATGWPVAVGTSRKSFLAALAAGADRTPAPVDDRLEPSLATAAWAVARGAAMIRVHDVRPTAQLVRLAAPRVVEARVGAA
jgi:dihydropteroate synthase